jgi:acyl-CoA thioesterase
MLPVGGRRELMGSLDEAVTLEPAGTDRWTAYADPDHESMNGMFGGWTSAISLAAVIASAEGTLRPSALTINYVAVVAPRTSPIIHVEHLGGSRSIDHWRADLRASEGGDLQASASLVLTSRRPTEEHDQWTMPDAPGPDTLEEFHAPGTQGQQTDIRRVSGQEAAYGGGDTRTSAWIRMASDRRLDHLQLAYLADQFAPRSFYWGVGPRPSATITMSVYFHATEDEISEVGTGYILNEATGTRGSHATSGQQGRLWSPGGALLATTEQLAWYR